MNKGGYFWIKALLVACIAVASIKLFALMTCVIPFSGMENTLYQGDRILINKWSYGLRLPFMTAWGYHRWGKCQVGLNDIVAFNNPRPTRQETPADRREVFVSRCIGLPGDTLMLTSQLNPVSLEETTSPDYKSLYHYPRTQEDTLVQAIKQLEFPHNELIGFTGEDFIRSFSRYEVYLLKQKLGDKIVLSPLSPQPGTDTHPFIVPRKGSSLRIYPWNAQLLCDIIRHHEGRNARLQNDTLWIDDRKAYSYLFTQNYYWMSSDNSININDSRRFGFVPEDHIIGRASIVWFSKEPETGILDGYRWNRFFHAIK